jgi:alcohol dehydrogenase
MDCTVAQETAWRQVPRGEGRTLEGAHCLAGTRCATAPTRLRARFGFASRIHPDRVTAKVSPTGKPSSTRVPVRRRWRSRAKPGITAPTDAIVRISRTTICGTDLHSPKGEMPSCTLVSAGARMRRRHQASGLRRNAVQVGDPVLSSCIRPGGQCSEGRREMFSHCTTGGWILGNTIDGTQAEFVRIPHADHSRYHIPAGADKDAPVKPCRG